MSGSEAMIDKETGTVIINDTAIPNQAVMDALTVQHPEIAALVNWSRRTQEVGRHGGIFQRDRYLTPATIFDQFKIALDAVETDDVVSGVMETTESLAFNNIIIDCDDEDERDVWNQILEDIDFYTRAREMWRELFSVSQYYAATYWVRKDYKVRGKTKGGNRKKKEFRNLLVPGGITLLDPLKVVPVGNFMFGKEQLAYIADRDQVARFDDVLANKNTTDLVVEQLLIGKYTPNKAEKKYLHNITGKNVDNLYLLNPNNVWRHTATRPAYQRFATVRMKSIFEILDLKQQLRQMDRAHLIGGPLRVDQRIATPAGWKPIGAARVGDEVFSVDGKPTTIIGVFPQGVLSMYKVTFTDGAVVYCDESHPWTVFDRSGCERTITLKQILDEGLFEANGPGKRVHKHRIPVASPLELPESDLPLDPYLVGYLLGDGSLSQSIPKITCAEPESDQPWRDVLPAGVTVSQYENREGFCYQYGLKGSEWRINEVTEGLREIGLWGTTCEDKYIPELYLWGSIDQRWALLQGLCDSDGSPSGSGGVEFSTVSLKLAEGVVQLVQSLGGVAKVYEREANGNERLSYRVHISLNQKDAPFRIVRKVAKWRPRKYPIVRAIHSVEKSVDAEAVCIKTAREDGLFLTEGMVVTHNTNFIVLVKKGSDQRPATPQEMHSLANQVKMASRVPVIVGDHRLEVEIVTPKMDFVLIAEKYNALDSRITARLFQMFMCVDEETEAFTIDGWKKHSELQVDDLILTLNTETGLSEWLPVQDIKKYDVDMDLWFMESQSHSSFTTPNHRWWTYQRSSLPHLSRWQWRQSSELTAASCIPLAVPHAQLPTEPKFSDAFVELVAWYITEGSDKCDSDGVQIAQSQDVNPVHCAQIRRALTEVFGPEGYAPDGLWHQSPSGMAFELRAEAGRALREVAPNKVPRQEVLLNLTQAQLELFIDRCIDADGCLSDRVVFFQDRVKNEKILDAFIFACILAGKPVSRKRHSDTVDKVTILKNSFTRPISAAGQSDDSVAEYRPYKGVVWCPHTPNMTFLARRNGHMYWTGNTGNYSAGAKGDDSIKLARVVARGMETRRNMIGLNTLRNLILPTFRKNEQFTEEPSIQFQPRRIALDFDPNVLNFLQELRDRGDLSRETILSEMDISQDKEARNRKTEEELYDETFKPPMIMLPPGTPGGPPAPPEPQETGPTAPRGSGATTNKTGKTNGGGKAAGRSGGRKGGANRDSFNSNPGRGPSKSMLEGMSTDELNDLIDTALQMLGE